MNKKIIDYKIISSPSNSQLREIVVDNLKRGWTPQGGLSTKMLGREEFLIQAMVKHED